MSSFSTTTARPLTASGTSTETTWSGTRSRSRSNHHSDSCVSTAPLPGMGVGRMWSKAEMLSVATISTSPAGSAYISRTFPAWMRGRPSDSNWLTMSA